MPVKYNMPRDIGMIKMKVQTELDIAVPNIPHYLVVRDAYLPGGGSANMRLGAMDKKTINRLALEWAKQFIAAADRDRELIGK